MIVTPTSVMLNKRPAIIVAVPKRYTQPWLPKGFSFLSGLSTAARKRRVLVPIQVFADESGGKGHTRHFLMAGLMCHSEAWAQFSDDWQRCLDARPRIQYFKMKEAAACTNEFYGFTEPQRDDKLRELARIINRHASAVTYSCIDLNAHADTWAKHLPKPHSEEYFWPYQNTIMASCFELWDAGLRERFEIIFDEHVIFGPRARAWYPIIQEILRLREPEAATILPVDPMFRDDKDFLPLQAADLFAWCLRDATDIGGSSDFEWLLAELRSVSLSDYSQYYDRARMNDVLDQMRRMMRDGEVPLELVERFHHARERNKKR